MKLCRVCISLCILLTCFFSYGQNSGEITFIRFNTSIGYVIDSAENQQCKCVKDDRFNYGSLIQLPNGNVFFKMKISGYEAYSNIPVTKQEADKIAGRISRMPGVQSGEDDEKKYLILLADGSEAYNLMDYSGLKFTTTQKIPDIKSLPDSVFRYTYFQAGLGVSSRSGEATCYSLLGDLGIVRNRSIYSGRIWYNRKINFEFNLFGGNPKEKITEFGLLYGRLISVEKLLFSINIGVSYSRGVISGGKVGYGTTMSGNAHYETREVSEIGIPMKFEMLIGSSQKSMGSIAFLTDINGVGSYVGMIFSFRISNEKRVL